MKEETTKAKDSLLISRKTEYVPAELPYKELPNVKVFDARIYKDREWMLFFLEKKFWNELNELCEKKGLDPKKVIWGSIVKSRDMLRGEKKEE